mmetsp:Transcript_47323/g.112481  ORF Transcript_47323/g.112481 Transcript_47323/m.112481 type:complete len:207 (-) Transcript_47323:184-804(-)
MEEPGPRPLVHHLSFGQEDDVIDQIVDLRAGLMNREHHRHASPCQLVQSVHQGESIVGVQATDRLVQKDHLRVGDQLYANGHALLLATRQTLAQRTPHDDGGRILQMQVDQKLLHQLIALGLRHVARKSQICGKLEALSWSVAVHERIVLEHIRRLAAEVAGRNRPATGVDVAREMHFLLVVAGPGVALQPLATGEDVQQRGLARA